MSNKVIEKKKKFIVTIDTEGDNLWNWKEGEEITTKNVYYLDRFQNLCNQYGFKPVYLSNWEMVQNDDFVCWIRDALGKIRANWVCIYMHGIHLR